MRPDWLDVRKDKNMKPSSADLGMELFVDSRPRRSEVECRECGAVVPRDSKDWKLVDLDDYPKPVPVCVGCLYHLEALMGPMGGGDV